MAANASRAYEMPVIRHKVSFESEDATPARVALDSDELCDRGLPALSATAPPCDAYSTWRGWWRRLTPRC